MGNAHEPNTLPLTLGHPRPTSSEIGRLEAEDEALLRHFVELSRAANTVRAYKSDLKLFEAWCRERKRPCRPATPDTVARYASHLAKRCKRKYSTIRRAMAAITVAHRSVGFDPPTKTEAVKVVLAGIRREIGTRKKQARPLLPKHFRRILEVRPNGLRWCRNWAMLLVGFTAALRRAELVAVRVEDLRFKKNGVAIFIPASKTDPDGKGEWVGVPEEPGSALCPVAALRRWLKRARIEKGFVFRRTTGVKEVSRDRNAHLAPRVVASVVRLAVKLIGLEPKRFSGHSLRRGFVSASYAAERTEAEIMRQTRHKSAAQAREYYAPDVLGERNAARGLLAG